jgi:5'-nucleotidase
MLHKATFSVLACNEIGTNLDLKAKPYQVFQRGSLKIGVLGIGASSTPLLHSAELDILNQANHFAHHLRQVERVDYVVALSHLGYWHTDGRISDLDLARQSENIDLIIGGQSHTFMEEPIFLNNKKGRSIAIKHAGCDGALLGQIDIQFFSDGRAPELNCKNNVLSMA